MSTWPPDAWKIGGGTVWGWISYDPETQPHLLRHGKSGAVESTTCARATTSGRCTHLGAESRDRPGEMGLPESSRMTPGTTTKSWRTSLSTWNWQGKMRKLLLHPARCGFMLVLDRETGELLSAEPFEPTNWAKDFNLKTGLPDIDPDKVAHTGVYAPRHLPVLHRREGIRSFGVLARSPVISTFRLITSAWITKGRRRTTSPARPISGSARTCIPGPGGYRG